MLHKSLVLVFLALAMGQGACVVVPRGASQPVAAAPACHPSQYWDGHQCRHKGQGRGARKHDGWR